MFIKIGSFRLQLHWSGCEGDYYYFYWWNWLRKDLRYVGFNYTYMDGVHASFGFWYSNWTWRMPWTKMPDASDLYLVIDHSRSSSPAVVKFETEAAADEYVQNFKRRYGESALGWALHKVHSYDELTEFQKLNITTWKPE